MHDKIVFDIETKNIFEDVGGAEHIDKLEVSVVGTYSYATNTYRVYDETELDEVGKLFQNAYPLIGFFSKRFDVPVLAKHFHFNLSAIPHYDIFEEVEKKLKRRIGLGVLAEANLGVGKTAHGLEAIEFYRTGQMQKLKDYCENDVRITKGIYDLIVDRGYLWIPERTVPQMTKIEVAPFQSPPPQNRLI